MSNRITQFPINTINRFATEYQSGLCPALCASVTPAASASTSAVVSEYGIRVGIKDRVEDLVSGQNLGVGSEIFKEFVYVGDRRPQFRLRSITTQNPKRVSLGITNNTLVVNYDGRPGFDQIYVNNYWVQGGSHQLRETIENWAYEPGSLVSGYSVESIPICANVDAVWDTDIAIAKIAVKIPAYSAFKTNGQVVGIGTTADPYFFGKFYTKTSGEVSAGGEWYPLIYSSGMYTDQNAYFENRQSIFAYTTGADVVTNSYSLLPTKFDLRIWFDKIDYTGITIYPFDAILMGGYYLEALNIAEKYTVSTDTWSTLANLVTKRRDSAGFSISNTAYLIGGGASTGVNKRLDAYFSSTNTWQIVNSSISNGRSFLGAWHVPSTTTAVVGPGYGSNHVDMFDSSTNAWTEKTRASQSVYGAAYAYSNDYGWIYGGTFGTSDTDVKTNQRYSVTLDTWVQKAQLPAAHDGAYGGGCAINNKNYFFGSRTSNKNHEYNATTDVWTEKTSLNGDKKRWHMGALSLYSKGFVFGGRLTKTYVDSNGITNPRYSGTYTDLTEYYNSYSNTWVTKQYMSSAREIDNSLTTSTV